MFCSGLIFKVPAGNVFCLQSGSWDYFALLPLGWKMAVAINVDTQHDVADLILDIDFLNLLFNFPGPSSWHPSSRTSPTSVG